MIQLTDEQRQQLREAGGNPVRLADPQTKQTYVILPETVYERIKALVYDDSPLTEEEKCQQLAESGKQAGWDDPGVPRNSGEANSSAAGRFARTASTRHFAPRRLAP